MQIKSFDAYMKETAEVGYVESVVTPLFYVSGLPTIRPQEIVVTENGTKGIVQVVFEDLAEVLLLESRSLNHQERVARTTESVSVEAGEGLLGRIIDPFGVPIDGLGPVSGERVLLPIDKPAPGIIERVKITDPLETGVTIVDLLVQVGKGQKELIAGDQKTGKSTFLLQAITRQVQLGAVCVYVSVGKRKSDVKYVADHLKKTGAIAKTIIVGATSSDPVALVYFAPFSGFSIAEYFRDRGQDVLIIIDDMTTHARYYREIALVARKTPGRGSYPGDVFHLQARLLERTGRVKIGGGKSGSVTALPVAETQEGDLTGYIQTNLMAMTDGHIFFDVDEFKRGRLPAINPTLSVTRVGNQTQSNLEKELRGWLYLRLNDYYRVRETLSFGVEVPLQYQVAMELGEKIEHLFNQDLHLIIPRPAQIILFGLLYMGFWNEKDLETTKKGKEALMDAYIGGKLKDIEVQVVKAGDLKALSSFLNKNLAVLTQLAYGNIQQKTTR